MSKVHPVTEIVCAALNDALIPLGYRQRGRSWYFDAVEATLVIHLDKSQHGLAYEVYLAVMFQGRRKQRSPRFNQCSWYGKLVCPVEGKGWAVPGLDFTDDGQLLRGKERPPNTPAHSLGTLYPSSVALFAELVVAHGVPFLQRIATRQEFVKAYEVDDRFRHFPLLKKVDF